MNKRDQLSALLLKYKQGNCSEKELDLLEMWLSELDQSAEQELKPSNEAERLAIQRNMRKYIIEGLGTERPDKVRKLWPALTKIAAVMFMILTAGYFINPRLQQLWGEDMLQQTVVAWDTISTPQGKIKKIILDDQSTLFLSANSKIRIAADFGKSNRNTELISGEAWFDVVKNPDLPFIVKSGKLETVVLGTQFMVTAYRQFAETEVTVTRGKVRVQDGQQSRNLTPGQAISYQPGNGQMEFMTPAVTFDPIQQRYQLTGCSFAELSRRIEDIYGYTLVPASAKVSERHYTGEISLAESVSMVMTKFLEIHHYKFQIRGKEVHIQ